MLDCVRSEELLKSKTIRLRFTHNFSCDALVRWASRTIHQLQKAIAAWDDNLRKQAQSLDIEIAIMNPVDYIRREVN